MAVRCVLWFVLSVVGLSDWLHRLGTARLRDGSLTSPQLAFAILVWVTPASRQA